MNKKKLHQRQCKVEGCFIKHRIIKGLCYKHYVRMKRNGITDLLHTPMNQMNAEQRKEALLKKRNITDSGCWEWTGTIIQQTGYGGYGRESVHRIAANLWLGMAMESEFLVCHHCDNPPCFNPEHLFLGTHSDNRIDAEKKGIGTSKLLKEDVESIRELRSKGTPTAILANMYNTSTVSINKLLRGKTYKWVL